MASGFHTGGRAVNQLPFNALESNSVIGLPVARAAALAYLQQMVLFGQFLHMYFDRVAVGGGFSISLTLTRPATSINSRIGRESAGRDARSLRSAEGISGPYP